MCAPTRGGTCRGLFAAVAACLVSAAGGISVADVYPRYGSTFGGTYLVISGSGFSFPSEFNPWDSQRVSVGSVPCRIVPHYTSAVQIVCVTGPAAEPFVDTDWLDVSVQTFYGLAQAEYARKVRAFRYMRGNTPNIVWGQSWAATGGSVVSFAGEIWSQAVDSAERFEMKVGDALCGMDEEQRPLYMSRRRSSTRQWDCQLPNDDMLPAGHHNVSLRIKQLDPNRGQCPNAPCFARNRDEGLNSDNGWGAGPVVNVWVNGNIGRVERVWAGVPDFQNGDIYHFSVYPEVSSVSPSQGGLHGGQRLVISGSSFSAEPTANQVSVGDVPCSVVFASVARLECILGSRADTAPGTKRTPRGLVYRTYRPAYNAWDTVIEPTSQPFQIGVLKAQIDFVHKDWPYEWNLDHNNDHYFRETLGFFVPPLTADYSFYLAGDDTMSLELGANESEASLARICAVRRHVSTGHGVSYSSPSVFYYLADIDGNGFTGPNQQVSVPVALEAGRRYAFRLRHTAYNGWEWTRIGMKISGIDNASLADGSVLATEAVEKISAAHPASELQLLRMRMTSELQREQHIIVLTGVSADADFRLRLSDPWGNYILKRFWANVNASTLQTFIRDAQILRMGEDPRRVHNCHHVRVAKSDADGNRTFTVTFDCHLAAGATRWVSMAVEEMWGTTVSVGLQQNASLPVDGTFRVGFNGQWTQEIAGRERRWDWLARWITNGLRQVPDGQSSGVEVEAWPDPHCCPSLGFDMWVRFRLPRGDVPALQFDQSLMTGEHYEFSVVTVEDGEYDSAMLDRVPADYFEMPPPDDPAALAVRVVTNGVVGGSQTHAPPTFTYSGSLTPVLESLSPSVINVNQVVTIEVSGIQAASAQRDANWTEDLTLTFGVDGIVCGDLAETTASAGRTSPPYTLQCVVRPGPAGLWNVTLLSKAQGRADPAVAPTVSYQPVVTSLSPSVGSLAGGTMINVTGDGLAQLPCSAVTVGGLPCDELSRFGLDVNRPSDAQYLLCLTPPLAGFNASAMPSTSQQDVAVEVKVLEPFATASVVRGQFTYSVSSTPYVQAVSPQAHSAARCGIINFTGQLLGGGPDPPFVSIDDRPCEVQSHSGTDVSCWLKRSARSPPANATQTPRVWVPERGLAAVDAGAATLEYRFEVHAVTPAMASMGGGAVVTISGAGFHPLVADRQTISLFMADGTSRPCAVLGGNSTELRCEVQGGAVPAAGRRLGAQGGGGPDEQHKCSEGAADESKAYCFAQAALAAGTVRSIGSAHHHAVSASLERLAGKSVSHQQGVHHIVARDALGDEAAAAESESISVEVLTMRRLMSQDDELNETDLGDDADDEQRDLGHFNVTLNTVAAGCAARGDGSSTCDFGFSSKYTPTVVDMEPRNGSFANDTTINITISTSIDASDARVFFGAHECPVTGVSLREDRVDSATVLEVPLCKFAASTVPLKVLVEPFGYAVGASPYTGYAFRAQQFLQVHSLSPPEGSRFGGTNITLRGAGFGATPVANRVTIGNLPCEVSAASVSELHCFVPVLDDSAATREVLLEVLTKVEADEWTMGAAFTSCTGSAFDPRAEPEPEPEAEPEPETEPEPEPEPEMDAYISGFTITGLGNIRMHKAACSEMFGTVADSSVLVPAGAIRVGVTFKIQEPCDQDCSPLWVTLSDPTSGAFYRWCYNRKNSGDCDQREDVSEQVWHLRKFEVSSFESKHGYKPELLKLSLGVYAVEGTATTYINEVIFEEPAAPLKFDFGEQAASPQITTMSLSSAGSELHVSGINFGSAAGLVALGTDTTPTGNFQCDPTQWNDTSIVCTMPLMPAGGWMVRAWNRDLGWSAGASDLLTINTVVSEVEMNGEAVDVSGGGSGVFSAGFGGEVALTLRGTGLGMEPSNMEIHVCNETCTITRVNCSGAIQSVTCRTPARRSVTAIDAYPQAYPTGDLAPYAVRYFTDRAGTTASQEALIAQAAFTSPADLGVRLHHDGAWRTRQGCWFAFEVPAHKQGRISSVEFFPPTDRTARNRITESVFEVRNLTDGSPWQQIGTLVDAVWTGASIAQGWTSYPVEPPVLAQAFRVRVLPNGCEHHQELMRGVRFTGVLMDTENSSDCGIFLRRVSHPQASLTGVPVDVLAKLQHNLARTPVLERIAPNRGTARGDTLVSLFGSGLQPLAAGGAELSGTSAAQAVQVTFNGYPCQVTSVNATVITCLTAERTDGITPPSTVVWIGGRGRTIITGGVEETTFRYIDKWSNVYSWKDSEPPVDGDSVIIPEGQAILLDRDSPRLFFLLVSGLLEFDRRDLALNATYIWVAGGHLSVGTEQAPFLNQATITLHGDRWYTIELPFVGAKMIAVTNLGGLHGGCHTMALRENGEGSTPCHVRSVGKLDLHGKPGVSWTRLVETVQAGATRLRLEEAVDWPAGARIVVTPSNRGQTEEVRRVLSLHENGFVVEVDAPLSHMHLGEWWFHEQVSGPTDLRAAVGLLTRNIKVQGDDASARAGNAFMFGAHMAVFFGGEMRVENTEYFRTGQSANFGRYSSHWHNLSPGRTVDVLDKAYLRNNSYHDTFQRAVVVHGTDYCVVRDNVAHRTKGHSFFTEAGDEHFALFEHNLAVNPQPHHVLLEDDLTPAGFWLPGFTGWHRNNMAANCARGWRLQKLSGVAASQAGLTFFNNSAHACGFGWHLKPPHAPRRLQTFESFTAFRCSTGLFYYSTGNIRHEDHRLIECGTGHFNNHFTTGLHTQPFYTNLLLVGNIDPNARTSRAGLGMRLCKDTENFMVSGMKTISFWDTPVLFGCFETVCTTRWERTEWYNSTKYTRSTSGISGIYWDLDGSMTGYKNGFVTFDTRYMHYPGLCEHQSEHHNGIVCGASDGSVRLRRLHVKNIQPWQLDGKGMIVESSVGRDTIPYTWRKLEGWGVPVLSGKAFDTRINDPNDFRTMTLDYAYKPYVVEEHGWELPKTTPINEAVELSFNFTDWRNHYDSSVGPRLSRRPTPSDGFGAHSMFLRADMCDAYDFTNATCGFLGMCEDVCNGEYTNETGWDLKKFLEEYQPRPPEPDGGLTTVLSVNVTDGGGESWGPAPGTPWSLVQTLTARECPVGGCPTPAPPPPRDPDARRLWSDADGWPDGRLPQAGDNVVIGGHEWVALDIETPVLHWVTVEGKLEFDRASDAKLNVHSLKVWGTLEIGTVEDPFPAESRAEVVFYGDEDAHTVIMTEGFYLVNKVLAVLGNLSAVGTPVVPTAWAKLAGTAESEVLRVQGNVSGWPVGARVGITATEYPQPPATTETEVGAIGDPPVYDPATDTTTVRLRDPLVHRHFAGDVAGEEGGHWPSARLAAAVALLGGRSNIVFRTAVPGDFHGGVVVIGGSEDGQWRGHAELVDVDFVGMGKHYYQAPALHFLYLGQSIGRAPPSRIERCVFSSSQSGAIEMKGASNAQIIGNVFHKTYRTALWVTKESVAHSIVLRNNIAIETLRHPRESTSWIRPFAAFLIEVPMLELAGNVAAGSTDSGFVLRPTVGSCETSAAADQLAEHQLNEAVGCMTGFWILRACRGLCSACAQLRGVIAWKNSHAGIVTADQSSNVRIDAVLLSDNYVGMTLNFHRGRRDIRHRIYADNVTLFGSTSASTCDGSTECRALGERDKIGLGCNSLVGNAFRRVGVLMHVNNNKPKLCEASPKMRVCRPPITPVKECAMPWERRAGTQGSIYSEAHWNGVTFGHFRQSDCGRRSAGITLSPHGMNTAYPQFFQNVRWFASAHNDSRINLDPSYGSRYIQLGDDGMMFATLYDVDGSLLETGRSGGTAVSRANPELATSECESRPGYLACDRLKLRFLTWEAMGAPSHRVLGPMKVWRHSDGRATWSRGSHGPECIPDMDTAPHQRGWQLRTNDIYNLTLFASPPKHHRLAFFNADPDPVRLDIFLTQPFKLEVYVDGVLRPDNEYDTSQKQTPRYPNLSDPHGSYAFDPHQRRFYLTLRGGEYGGTSASFGGGVTLLRLLQVVQLSLTMDIPAVDFDGPALVQNVATLLQIDASRIRIVQVQSRAEVAAQGGLRRLSSGGTEIVVHISEENPEPIPSEYFDFPTNDSDDGVDGAEDDDAANETDALPSGASFSVSSLAELQSLATRIQEMATSGNLSEALGVDTSVEVEVSNPQATTMTTTPMSSSNSTTISTTIASTTEALLPDFAEEESTTSEEFVEGTSTPDVSSTPTQEAELGIAPDQAVAIAFGAIVGAVAGIGTIGGGLWVARETARRRRLLRERLATDQPPTTVDAWGPELT